MLRESYEAYRRDGQAGWGFAWWLAAEFCERFFASHGIVPHIIEREGLGYYGIQFDHVACAVHGSERRPLGRLTMAGNVENWSTGSPGDHGLKLEDRAAAGEPLSDLLGAAIAHLELSPLPSASHVTCRHKRWGASYNLIFRIAAILAIKHSKNVEIWNHPATVAIARELDLKQQQREHLGHFLLQHQSRSVVIAGDGRVLDPPAASLWERYMAGDDVAEFVGSLEAWLALDKRAVLEV